MSEKKDLLREYRQYLTNEPFFFVKNSAFDPATWLGVHPCVDRWHELVRQFCLVSANKAVVEQLLTSCLHEDIVFHPPTYWYSCVCVFDLKTCASRKVRKGKQVAMWILGEVSLIFGSR